MEAERTRNAGLKPRERPSRAVEIGHYGALLGAAGLIGVTAGSAHWTLSKFAVIAVMTVVSDLTRVEVSSKVDLSGSFLGIVVATVLLGGGPAAVIGMLTIAATWL